MCTAFSKSVNPAAFQIICASSISANSVFWGRCSHTALPTIGCRDRLLSFREKKRESKFYFTEMQFPCASNRFECVCVCVWVCVRKNKKMHLIKWEHTIYYTVSKEPNPWSPLRAIVANVQNETVLKHSHHFQLLCKCRKKKQKAHNVGFVPIHTLANALLQSLSQC